MIVIDKITAYLKEYFTIPAINWIDIFEILIIAVILYYLILWFKRTRAWTLFKGILIVIVAVIIADLFQFNTILWIAEKTVSVLLIALVVIFQPELRNALDKLGQGRLLLRTAQKHDVFALSSKSVDELIGAVKVMSDKKTGALISIENKISLEEYESTGIVIDSAISRQLILNIFEDKTPLHDGAVIIRDDRIVAATCYLPMTKNEINKKYGTRHRAAVGISELTDSFTIIVSEETGYISIAEGGALRENVNIIELKNELLEFATDENAKASRFSGVSRKITKVPRKIFEHDKTEKDETADKHATEEGSQS